MMVMTSALIANPTLRPGWRNNANWIRGSAVRFCNRTNNPIPSAAPNNNVRLTTPKSPRPNVIDSA
ncbi:hypothetical protein D3C87_2104380 [compost metagenome]